jgi:hypothetical protein
MNCIQLARTRRYQGRVRMKRAIVSILVLAAVTTSVSFAQEGSGHGPPKAPIIILPSPLPMPMPTLPPVPPKLSQFGQP